MTSFTLLLSLHWLGRLQAPSSPVRGGNAQAGGHGDSHLVVSCSECLTVALHVFVAC